MLFKNYLPKCQLPECQLLKRQLPRCLGVLIFLFMSVAHAAEPVLNGLAVQADLGKEQFIGALYSSLLSDNLDTLTAGALSMRMELKITSPDGMALRRFSRMWIEGMAINNPPALLTEQADSMVKFDGFFKGRLLPNDNVAFSFASNQGVNVLVNDVLLGNIPSDKFFAMLLRTWAGKVPPSTEFKNNILKAGNVSAELKGRFDKIKATRDRISEVGTWVKAKPPAELVEEKKDVGVKSAARSSSADSQKQVIAIRSEPARSAVAVKTATVKPEESKPEEPKPLSDEDEQPALTTQTLLARQFYVSELMKRIRANARYPKRALERKQEGSIRIAVSLDRKGNIMGTSMVEESKYPILNEAAQELITKAAPLPPMPDTIPGEVFEFTAPVTFALPK